MGTTKIDIMHPGTQCSVHINPARGVHWEDFPGTFFCNAGIEHIVVELLGFGKEHLNTTLKCVYHLRIKIGDGVLPVFDVLAAEFWDGDIAEVFYIGISLREFLERKRPMPDNLRRNVSGGVDLNAH